MLTWWIDLILPHQGWLRWRTTVKSGNRLNLGRNEFAVHKSQPLSLLAV